MSKKNEKKLSLKSETLRNLTAQEMGQVNGGISTTLATIVITATVTTLTETCKVSTSNATSLVSC